MTEHFDLNRVQISGAVQKIWDWDDDIFFSLTFEEADKPRYITMRLSGGMIGGKLISLQPDDKVTVTGYLVDSPHTESIENFLSNARKPQFLKGIPEFEQWAEIHIKRVDTRLDVTDLQMNGAKLEENSVQVQGLVVKAWKGGADRFARLAIYDQHTSIIGHNPAKGLPRRKPHYITVRFVDGKVDGHAIELRSKQRLRVSGSINIHFYKQSLFDVLLKTQNAELMENLVIDEIKEIGAVRTSLYVLAQSAIVLGSRGRQVNK